MRACLEFDFPIHLPRVMRRVLPVFACATFGICASASLLQAQSGSPPVRQSASAVLPSAPEYSAAPGPFLIPVAPPESTARSSWLWKQSTLDPNSSFSSYLVGTGDNAVSTTAPGFGSQRQGTGGFNWMGGTAAGQRGFTLRGSSAPFSTDPLRLPSLNQFMRGGYNLPFTASASGPRFTYKSPFKLGDDLARPPTTGLYATSDLGNGMLLSAGTNYGRSNVGAPAVGANAAAAKHSGPSVGVKLSF